MVKTRGDDHAELNKKLLNDAIGIFGTKTLTHRIVTETLDNYGQLSAISNSDTTFTGDLQFYPDVDEKFINTGMINVGEAVLYINPDALTTKPVTEDLIVYDGGVWAIVSQLEAPELGGETCHYSYKCIRRPNGDN